MSIAGAQQPIGSVALGDLVQGLGVSTRVLVIGAHPDDEDTYLISWLARGKHVETAYLSLTRGEGGQNLLGDELGIPLGQIRTQELLAARRIDGGHQFFTRALDFGFSKTLTETEQFWPRDTILRDVVAIIRAYKPQVIVSVWTGTPADGHGHHQYAGVIAREAFDAAADSTRVSTKRAGEVWAPLKFYHVARVNGGFSVTPDSSASSGNITFNVGQYDPGFGRSYAELAAISRSQHLSQGMGMLQPLGTLWDGLWLDTSRVGLTAATDHDLFAGIDTSWNRFRAFIPDSVQRELDSMRVYLAQVKSDFDALNPDAIVTPASELSWHTGLALGFVPRRCEAGRASCVAARADLFQSLSDNLWRAQSVVLDAAGVRLEALADRERVATGDSVGARLTVYNRGKQTVAIRAWIASGGMLNRPATLQPGGSATVNITLPIASTQSWWLRNGVDPRYALFRMSDSDLVRMTTPADLQPVPGAAVSMIVGTPAIATAPLVFRFADPARGEQRHPVAGVPKISTVVENNVEFVRAGKPIDREVVLEVRSASTQIDTVTLSLSLPAGVTSDSIRRVVLPPSGRATVNFVLHGTLKPGSYKVEAKAADSRGEYTQGYVDVAYEHIPPIQSYRKPELSVTAVDVTIPTGLNVAYVHGVGDNIAPILEQLGVKVTPIAPELIPKLDPKTYSTLVIGPRAYEAIDAVAANGRAVQEFARRGGTVVVQYQQRPDRPGVLPFPVTLSSPADRVTDENASVTILAPTHKVVTWPNRITQNDFAGWVQERGLYMPHTIDEHWKALLEMHDAADPPNYGGVLVTPLGQGQFVYTTLSFFRQLPAGNPGAARLFVDLLSAGLRAGIVP
jgi:LmbE family N-acetylglucosaminyl deacetylase